MVRKIAGFKIVFVLILCSCAAQKVPERTIRATLDIILADDLASLQKDIPDESKSDSARYDVIEYRVYKEGSYTRLAVVDFYFLNGVSVKVVRKYRYQSVYGKWERYFNEYRFVQ
jgi:hypothetical protein